MLRSLCRIRPVANLAVFHAAARHDVGQAAGLRRLSATTVDSKSKQVRATIRKQKAERLATKAAMKASTRAATKAAKAAAAKSTGEDAADVPNDEDAQERGDTGATTPSQQQPSTQGPGVWMSLQARLQGSRKPKDTDDDLRIIQGEGEPAFFIQEAATPVEQFLEAEDGQGRERDEAAAEAEGEKKAKAKAKPKEKKKEKEAKKTKDETKEETESKKLSRRERREEAKAAKASKNADKDGAKAPKRAKKAPKAQVSTEELKEKKLIRKADSLNVKTLKPADLHLQPVEEDAVLNVPRLSYNLDRALFNPGVYQLQDPRSRVFNFDPYLTSIMPVDEFDFDALKEYITSSKDVKLRELSARHGMKYCGSTSSMTAMLAHFHFLLSAWRLPNLSTISRSLVPESFNFTNLTRGPAAAFAHFKDGVYAIDADKQYDTENILSSLGKSMEKLLTLPKEEYEKYRRTRSHQLTEEEKNAEESFHYTTMGDFMMRSQLDAHDPRLPGTGMFDLKTRAVVSIRMDVRGYEKGVGYEIRERFGQWESFEREYYDLIRSAFLKYSLQVRMGRMDGIFVAFHNTKRIFGFQYISLSEMDQALHGTPDTRLGDQEFKASVSLLNELLNKATERFPGKSLRLHVETRPTKVPLTYFFVEPVTDEEMREAQEAGKSSAEKIERDILSMNENAATLEPTETEEDSETAKPESEADTPAEDADQSTDINPEAIEGVTSDSGVDAAWESMMAKVEETIENESLGIGSVREAVQDALEDSGLLANKSELETEQCLDAMVSSLMAHSAKVRSLREKPADGDESLELSRETEEEPSSPEAATSSGEDAAAAAEEVSSEEEQQQQPQSRGTSLKDLILKATEDISEKQNPTTFQQMFADLATQSRRPATTEVDEEEEDVEEDEEEEMNVDTVSPEEEQLSSNKEAEEVQDEDAASDIEEDLAEDEAKEDDIEGENENEHEHEHDIEGEGEGEVEVSTPKDKSSKEPPEKKRELMGLYVTIRNKVNGKSVSRPNGNDKDMDWSIEYAVTEIRADRAHKIYTDIKKRRRTVLSKDQPSNWHFMFKGHLPLMTKKGEQFRQEREMEEANKPMFVAWNEEPLPNGAAEAEEGQAVSEESTAESEEISTPENEETSTADEEETSTPEIEETSTPENDEEAKPEEEEVKPEEEEVKPEEEEVKPEEEEVKPEEEEGKPESEEEGKSEVEEGKPEEEGDKPSEEGGKP